MIETDADRLAMLQALGEPMTLDGVTVQAMWSAPYADSLGVASRVPGVLLRASDCAAVTQSSVLVRAGVTYRVASVEPDGAGYVTLQLQRAA